MNKSTLVFLSVFLFLFMSLGCDRGMHDSGLAFPGAGPAAGTAGQGTFTFGVSTASTQIEDKNYDSDWYLWTGPKPGGMEKSEFVGDAVCGYTMAGSDLDLIDSLNMDAYRFSPSWSRIEPKRDKISGDALKHYASLLEAMKARGIKPMITVHHFSSPVWIDDPRRTGPCEQGPTDQDLCGLEDPVGRQEVIDEMAEYAGLLAKQYGKYVDEWCTLNEPFNYLLAAYGAGIFPPGRTLLLGHFDEFVQVAKAYLDAHAAMYKAIKENDIWDADGDGQAAIVGLTLSVAQWVPARNNQVSNDPADIAARDRIIYVRHHLIPQSLLDGTFDSDLDGKPDMDVPEWKGTLDFLGVQYYARMGVTSSPALISGLDLTPCAGGIDLGACVPPLDPTKWVPSMGYEYYEQGIYNVLSDFSSRWPDLPLVVTEAGLATLSGQRRAQHLVRTLQQIHRALEQGADVRGFYYWSLMDNFEWQEGYGPKFGLYSVDLDTCDRTATMGADVLSRIAGSRKVTGDMLDTMGGTGPMALEPE
ncbi:MAG: family 1 glycosylhydrolase [Deltaproteobacteria bacterium]|nr:family 1 glycosylhydrolase [Deltaproteobacteria bacterium]